MTEKKYSFFSILKRPSPLHLTLELSTSVRDEFTDSDYSNMFYLLLQIRLRSQLLFIFQFNSKSFF